MTELLENICRSADCIRQRWSPRPTVGIILGSGLGGFAETINAEASIPYGEIPGFSESTATGHAGQLVCGQVHGVRVVAMNGRFHLYEGHSAASSAFPVRVMKELGVHSLIISNASGGLNPNYEQGDIVVVEDQINLMFRNPLIGSNDERLGPRFPDMCHPFDSRMIDWAERAAKRHGIRCHRGVYAGVLGPNYETRAEIRMLRKLGADVVGMSTVPEVLVAVHAGIRVLGLSVVTNVCRPDWNQPTSGDEVVAEAQSAELDMRCIVNEILHGLNETD